MLEVIPVFLKITLYLLKAHFSDLASLESIQKIIPVECHVDNMTILNLTD